MCFMDAIEVDTQQENAFAERMMAMMNHAALGLMTSIGHRTGLFDTMAKLPPSTSPQIAAVARLNERYVREWLGAMATGGIVRHSPADGTYHLPREHADFLTRAAAPANLAASAQFFAVLGSVEDRIVDCFHNGGGVPYEAFARFHPVMAEESDQSVCAALFESILPLAPGLIERLERGIDAADIGCGSGHAALALAAAFPNSNFVGYDISAEAIAHARNMARERGLKNATFEIRDVAELRDEARFGLITAFDAVHDQAQPARVLEAITRALQPDGVFLMQDIAGTSHVDRDAEHPLGPFLYTISCMHCMTVSLARDGMGLGAMWGQELALRMLNDAGLQAVDVKRLEHDVMNVYFVARKSA
jgi:2-polyprenyl-3-methyl-5-hydroxy-6-metoxy-1,4-benzoquinol methylase